MHPTEMNIDPTKGVENKAKRVWKVHKLQSDLYGLKQSSHLKRCEGASGPKLF